MKNTRVDSHSPLQGIDLDPGIDAGSPTLQGDSLPSEPPGKPPFATCRGNIFNSNSLWGTIVPILQMIKLRLKDQPKIMRLSEGQNLTSLLPECCFQP